MSFQTRTAIPGELETASDYNTYVRDPLNALASGYKAIASQAALDFLFAASATQEGRLAHGTGRQVPRLNAAADGYEFGYAPVMNIGTFTRDTSVASGTQDVTGVGFQPRLVLFFVSYTDGGSAQWIGIGADDGTVAKGIRYAFGIITVVNAAESIVTGNDAGNATLRGHITTLGSDGFTITWTKTGTPTGTATIVYVAIQ